MSRANHPQPELPANIVERLASAKDKLPAGSDDRKAVWEAIELLRNHSASLSRPQDADPFGGLAAFTEYFVKNYPGPNTIICDPKWHAPRIFGEARYAILTATQPATATPTAGQGGGECATCNGRGEIGGFVSMDSGYQTDPCPECNEAKPPSVASVSERARELLATEYRRIGYTKACCERVLAGEPCSGGMMRSNEECALRAIEHALTQQRGEPVAWIGPRGDWIDNARFQSRVDGAPNFGDLSVYRPLYASVQHATARKLIDDAYNAGTKGEGYTQQVTDLHDAVTTTPQPSAEGPALTEREREWLEYAADHMDDDSEPEDKACAVVIRTLLARSVSPSAEGLRELCAVIVDNLRDLPVNADWAKRTADRLESLLAGAK